MARRISLSDLPLNSPLPWDLYPADAGQGPLLHKGHLLRDGSELQRLLERGLYTSDAAPSVLQLLNQSNRRLERLLDELRSHSDAERAVRDIAREVIQAVERNSDVALACIFQCQIAGTYAVRHCIETAVVAVLVARGMQKSQHDLLTITAAALTMNVGMLRHQETFQNKRTPLSREEQEIVRRHPEDSAAMLANAGVRDDEWIDCVILHHENEDGSGYPRGKTSAEITENAKLVGLADRYCAHVSARNYRRSMLPDLALRSLFVEPQQVVDPLLAEQFVQQLGAYPPGSLVRLQNGEIGVVMQRDGTHVVQVHALRDAGGVLIPATLPAPLRRTDQPGHGIATALHEDDAAVRFSMKNIWGDEARL